MVEELLKKMNNDNYNLIKELSKIIINNKFVNEDELKKYQDKLFVINGKELSHKEQVEYCKKIINSTIDIKEDIDFIDMQRILFLEEELKKDKTIDEETKIVVELMSLFEIGMLLPYDAYKMIMNS